VSDRSFVEFCSWSFASVEWGLFAFHEISQLKFREFFPVFPEKVVKLIVISRA
jgi:hypothetical protein